MDRVRFGRASVARVLELRFDLPSRCFPDTPPSGWEDNADLLVPDFFDPDTDKWHIAVQSWFIEVDGLTIVVDTGVGNDRQRPHMPPLDHLNTGFLAALQSAGIDRNTVDVVVNTHVHSDHVGWNTMLDERQLGADVSQRPISDVRGGLPPLRTRRACGATITAHRGGSGRAARQSIDVRRQRVTRRCRRTVRPMVRRLPDQSVAATAARSRAHAGVLGAVAGCGSAGGLRRRSHPQPAAVAPARRPVRVRRKRRRRRGHPAPDTR